MTERKKPEEFRSRYWFNDPSDPGATALHIERYTNFGLTAAELRSGKPIIGIAQTGSDLVPCNRVHMDLSWRMRDGIREAGGIPIEFPVHPIQESGKRPTAAVDRNLQYLSLVEVLYGYPIDGVILCTGCDKITPALLMGAATVNIPAIALNSGPMLNGYWRGKLAGSGTVVWEARKLHAAGEIDDDEFIELVANATPSTGHCNTMGTASTMNSLTEALGMSLPGNAAIPAPHKQRASMAYATGKRIVDMVFEDLTPSKIMTREAFENAIVTNSAIGGSTNAPIHINAIALHMGVELNIKDWQSVGHAVPLLVNLQPAGEYLGEAYYEAGGVPAVMWELAEKGRLHTDVITANGRTLGENIKNKETSDRRVIFKYDEPMMTDAGFVVLSGNLFDAAVMKTSVISDTFRQRYLQRDGDPDAFEVRAIVFEGPEDYHHRINDPALDINENCVLIIRNVGPLGYPGSAEVVNMQPPDALIKDGINELPTIGDGRQSGTSGSPSILNAAPEAAAGSGLALLKTGDMVRIDLIHCTINMLIDDDDHAARRAAYVPPELTNHTPWQEIYRSTVSQLDSGGVISLATKYKNVREHIPRHSH
jgi:dihydroxy-acid dehydratase